VPYLRLLVVVLILRRPGFD